MQTAQSAVDSDKAALTAAQAALDNLKGTMASDLQSALTAVETDNAQIAAAQLTLSNATGSGGAADLQSAQSLVTTDQALVKAAPQASLDSARSTRTALDHPSGQSPCVSGGDACSAAKTAADSSIASGNQQVESAQAALAQLEAGGPPATKAQLTSTLIGAQEKLKTDQAKLDALKNGGAQAQQATAQSTLTAGQQKLKADQAKLDALRNGTFDSQQASAQSTLIGAQQKLKTDQAKLDALKNGTADMQQAQLESSLEAANQKQTADQAKLDVMNAGPTDEDVRQARAAVMQAQQNLVKAQRPGGETDLAQQQAVVDQMQAQFQAKQTPYTDADLQAAVAAVAQAESAVALAQANLDQMTVVAPFDGVVSQRLLGPGSLASSSTPVVVLTSNTIEVHVTVEEARVGQVRPGQAVQLSVPAYPSVAFPAKVVTIAPAGDARAHTFDAKIVPDTQDERLLPGMYAQVSVVAAQKNDAVLVPKEAIVQQAGNQIVYVSDNGRAAARQVQTGMTDDKSVEIVGGVVAGEQVVVVGQNGLRDGAPIQVANAPAQGQGGQGGQGQQGQGQGGNPAQKPGGQGGQPAQQPSGGDGGGG